jgi:urea transport system permease protein
MRSARTSRKQKKAAAMRLIRAKFTKLAAATAFLFTLLCAPLALAGPFEDALPKLAADSFSDTADAIAAITASGHPDAEAVVSGIGAGRVLFDPATKSVYLRAADGSTKNLATGATEPAPATARAVRQNNRVRTMVDASLGTLRLMSPDPQKRLAAAGAVFKTRDVSALKLIDEALAKETDTRVKKVLAEARAAILIAAPNTSDKDRIAAIQTIGAKGDNDALSLLRSVPANASADVKAATAAAINTVERSLAFWEVGQNVWYGLSLGSVLLLAAIGLAITFGVMGVINMAHGEMVMIGAYVTFMVQEVIRQNYPGMFDYSLAIALPLAFLIAGFIGVLIERGIIRFLYGRPLETLLATWGLSLILQQAVRTAFGPTNREVGAPSWMSGAFELGGLAITYNRLWIIVFSMSVFVALLFVLRYTRFGLEMRAVTQNRRMASSMGIKTSYVDALTFGLGSGIAGIAGVALSQIDNVSPNLGQGYIIDSFLVVVFGGVGNLFGTLIAALSLGIANKFLEPFVGAVLGKIVILVLIIIFIQKKPRGMFALKGRAVEA